MPGMKWFYNSRTGLVQELPVPVGDVELHLGLGWHGPFDTQQKAIDFYNAGKAANPGWQAPTDNFGQLLGNATSAVTKPITDVTSGIAAFTNTVVKLVPRILEAAVGIVLLAIAANVILKQTTGVDVVGTGVKVGKKAAMAAAVV